VLSSSWDGRPFGHNRHGPKIEAGELCPFWEGELGPHVTQCMRPGLRPTFVPNGIFIHPAVWPQQTWAEIWRAVPLGGGAGSASNQMLRGPRLTILPSGILIHPAVWPQQTWAENWGGCVHVLGGGDGSPSSTMWPRPRPISIPSCILTHAAVRSQ